MFCDYVLAMYPNTRASAVYVTQPPVISLCVTHVLRAKTEKTPKDVGLAKHLRGNGEILGVHS